MSRFELHIAVAFSWWILPFILCIWKGNSPQVMETAGLARGVSTDCFLYHWEVWPAVGRSVCDTSSQQLNCSNPLWIPLSFSIFCEKTAGVHNQVCSWPCWCWAWSTTAFLEIPASLGEWISSAQLDFHYSREVISLIASGSRMISFFPASAIPWSRVWLETTWQEGPGGHCPVSQLCETHSRCKKLWHDNLGGLFLTLKGVQDGFGSHSTGIWEILDEFSWKPLHVTLGWSSCWDMVLGPPNLAEGTDKFYALKTFCRSSFIWAVRTHSKSEAQLLWLNDSHKRIPAQMGELWGSSGHWDSASFVERSFL